MQNLCPALVDIGTFACHLDYWAARYQSGFFGCLALVLAFTQWRIARRLSKISQEQFRVAQAQRDTDKAVAVIAVDQVLVPAARALGDILAGAMHTDTGIKDAAGWTVWHWRPVALSFFVADVPADFGATVSKFFPEDAPNLVQLGNAVSEASKLAREFAEKPWLDVEGHDTAGIGDRDRQKCRATDDALNRLFVFANRVGRLHPQSRVEA